MRSTISQRVALSSDGRARYATPPAAPINTVPCLENPGPIWTIVTPDGGAAPPAPSGVAETEPSGAHCSLVVIGRIDSIVAQRSHAALVPGWAAAGSAASTPATKHGIAARIIRGAWRDRTSH